MIAGGEGISRLAPEIATSSRIAGLLAMTTGVIANEGEAISGMKPGVRRPFGARNGQEINPLRLYCSERLKKVVIARSGATRQSQGWGYP